VDAAGGQAVKYLWILLLSASALGQCGMERIKVKNLRDVDAATIRMQPVSTTIGELIKFEPPAKVIGNNLPRQAPERQVYEVSAWVIAYKHEAYNPKTGIGDGDYHVVISTPGKPKETMIFEIPDPRCAPGNFAETFKQERAFIDSLSGAATPTFKILAKPVAVKLKFVLFFDKCHGQAGRAPNCVEGHPGLGIEKP
jgi:hypothetical protein